MALRHIDIDTPQPNGRFGEPTRSANIKHNANITETEDRLEALESGTAGTGTRLDEEIAARAAADAALAGRIDAEHALITQETADRVAAVQAEAAARANVDASLSARILGKNRIINGNFDIYQRGNPGTITNSAAYTADRWICSSAGAGVTSNWGLGGTTPGEIPDSVRFLGFNVVSGVTSAWVGQWIEGVHTFAGGKATVSFWMRSGVAGKKVGLLIQQHFGIGGSTMVEVQASSVITLTTNFTKYTVTFDVPSIAGKSVGGNNALLLTFFYADDRTTMFGGQLIGQTGLFEVAQVQMERGDKATEFEWRPPGQELRLCQRYYCKSFPVGIKPDVGLAATSTQGATAWNGSDVRTSTVPFPVEMRATPALRLYTSNDANSQGNGAALWNGSIWNSNATWIFDIASSRGFAVNGTFGSGLTVNGSYLTRFNWTADAEF